MKEFLRANEHVSVVNFRRGRFYGESDTGFRRPLSISPFSDRFLREPPEETGNGGDGPQGGDSGDGDSNCFAEFGLECNPGGMGFPGYNPAP